MKKWYILLLALVMALLVTACGPEPPDEPNPAPPEEEEPLEGPDALAEPAPGRPAVTVLLTYNEELIRTPAELNLCEGYSLYAPCEEWTMYTRFMVDIPVNVWESDLNSDIRLEIIPLGQRTPEEAKKLVADAAPYYILEDDGEGGLMGLDGDGKQILDARFVSDGTVSYALLSRYSVEAAGGFGLLLSVMADTFEIEAESLCRSTVFTYAGQDYDLAKRNGSINSIMDCAAAGNKLVLTGHVGPKNSVYCIFDMETETFETDFMGTNFIWEDDDLTTGVYFFQDHIMHYDGTQLAHIALDEGSYVCDLLFSEDGADVGVEVLCADGSSYIEYVSR